MNPIIIDLFTPTLRLSPVSETFVSLDDDT